MVKTAWEQNPLRCFSNSPKRSSDRCLGASADDVFAPRQQREQLEPEIGNKESSECDRGNAHKRIPDYGRHAAMNGVEDHDVRQVHAIAHARKIVYPSPKEAVGAIRMNVSEEQEESCGHDRN